MEKHKFQGKTKEEAIQVATLELQEVETNLIINEQTNLFTKEDGRYYNHQVGEIFAYALNQ